MFTEFYTLDDKLQEQLNSRAFPDSSLFFDIETTGLDHRRSHLYLLGMIFQENGSWKLVQLFAEKPAAGKQKSWKLLPKGFLSLLP